MKHINKSNLVILLITLVLYIIAGALILAFYTKVENLDGINLPFTILTISAGVVIVLTFIKDEKSDDDSGDDGSGDE